MCSCEDEARNTQASCTPTHNFSRGLNCSERVLKPHENRLRWWEWLSSRVHFSLGLFLTRQATSSNRCEHNEFIYSV